MSQQGQSPEELEDNLAGSREHRMGSSKDGVLTKRSTSDVGVVRRITGGGVYDIYTARHVQNGEYTICYYSLQRGVLALLHFKFFVIIYCMS